MNLFILNMLWFRSSIAFQRSMGLGWRVRNCEENWASGKSLAGSLGLSGECWMRAQTGFLVAIRIQLRSYKPSQAQRPEVASGKVNGWRDPKSITLGDGDLWSQTLGPSLCKGRSESRRRLVFVGNGRGGVSLRRNLVQGYPGEIEFQKSIQRRRLEV